MLTATASTVLDVAAGVVLGYLMLAVLLLAAIAWAGASHDWRRRR